MEEETKLQKMKAKADKLKAEHSYYARRVKEESAVVSSGANTVAALIEAQKVIQSVAQGVQQAAHDRLASVVTRCLRAVFDEPYEFRIDFEKRRGKTEADLGFYLGGKRIDPREGGGGGMLDVAAFGLRVACVVLRKPYRRRLMVFDEPFKYVNGEENQRRCGELVAALAEELDFQFVLVTDDDWLKVGKVIRLR